MSDRSTSFGEKSSPETRSMNAGTTGKSNNSPYRAFLEAENSDLQDQHFEGKRNCWRVFTKANFCAKYLRRKGLLFANDALEQEYELDFMRSTQNYKFIGVAGGVMTVYTIYLMSSPLVARLESLRKYSAIFDDPDNNEALFSAHAIFHGVLQAALNISLMLLALLKSKQSKLQLLRVIPVLALLWLVSLTLLFVEVELTNLWDWQSGLANITLGNINISTFTPGVTVKSCAQNVTHGVHVRDDGCEYSFELMSKFALYYGWVSGTTNSELFIANIWTMTTVLVVGKVFKASSMLVALPVLATGLFLVSCNPVFGITNLNVNHSLSTTVNCSFASREITVTLIYEMCLAVVIAMIALLYLVTVQERDNRELFFWTKILQVKQKNLLKQVDPFSPDELQQWFEDSLLTKRRRKQLQSSSTGSIGSLPPPEASFQPSTSGSSFGTDGLGSLSDRSSLGVGTNAGQYFCKENTLGSFQGLGSHIGLGSSIDSLDVSTLRQRPQREYWDIDEEDLQLDEVVAAGGAGVVWRATLDGKIVAAKKIRAMSDLMLQEHGIRELASEVRILGRLNHENILKFLGLCIKHPSNEDEPVSVFIVTEWCSQNLRTWIAKNAPSTGADSNAVVAGIASDRERYNISYQIANGMQYLHSRSVMHRDLKPENILITWDGRARICDFGLSVASKRGRQRSDSNELRGTPGYIAPEIYVAANRHHKQQARNSRRHQQAGVAGIDNDSDSDDGQAVRVTFKIDVYAFGIILWEIFARGGASFELTESRELSLQLETADAESIAMLVPRPDIRELDELCSKSLAKCMQACWSSEPSKRPTFKKIALTLRFALQYYDCGEDFDELYNARRSRGSHSKQHETAILLSEMDAADPTQDMSLITGGMDDRRRSTTLSAVSASRKPSASMSVYSLSSDAPRHVRGYAQLLYVHMRCWGPRNLHFASLAQEFAFVAATVTTSTYFRSLKVALSFILALYIARAFYLSNSIVYVQRHNNETYDPLDFFDLYILDLASMLWITVSLVAAFVAKCHKNWALWVRLAIITAELVTFVMLPMLLIPGLIVEPFTNLTSTGSSVTSNGTSTSVYAPLDSSFFMGYVTPKPDYLCGGTEWSPFLNSRQISFCQSLNFQFSYGTINFFRYFSAMMFYGLTHPVIMLGMGLTFRHYIEVIAIPCLYTAVLPFVMVSIKLRFTDYFPYPYLTPGCSPTAQDLDPVPLTGAVSDTAILVFSSLFASTVCIFMKLTYERQARSLFTIRESLKSQNSKLVDDVSNRQYKFIIEENQKELLGRDSDSSSAGSARSTRSASSAVTSDDGEFRSVEL